MSEFLDSGGLEYLIKNWAPSTAKYVNLERLPDDSFEAFTIGGSTTYAFNLYGSHWFLNREPLGSFYIWSSISRDLATIREANLFYTMSFADNGGLRIYPSSVYRDTTTYSNVSIYTSYYYNTAIVTPSYVSQAFGNHQINYSIYSSGAINSFYPLWFLKSVSLNDIRVMYNLGDIRKTIDMNNNINYSLSKYDLENYCQSIRFDGLPDVNVFYNTHYSSSWYSWKFLWTTNSDVLNIMESVFNDTDEYFYTTWSCFGLTYLDAFDNLRWFRPSINEFYQIRSVHTAAPYAMHFNRFIPYSQITYNINTFINSPGSASYSRYRGVGYLFYASSDSNEPSVPSYESYNDISNEVVYGEWTRNPSVLTSGHFAWTTVALSTVECRPPYIQTGKPYSIGYLSFDIDKAVPTVQNVYQASNTNDTNLNAHYYRYRHKPTRNKYGAYLSGTYSRVAASDGPWWIPPGGYANLASGSMVALSYPYGAVFGLELYSSANSFLYGYSSNTPDLMIEPMTLGINGMISDVRPIYLTTSSIVATFAYDRLSTTLLTDNAGINQWNVLSKLDDIPASFIRDYWCYEAPSVLDDADYCYAMLVCNNGYHDELIRTRNLHNFTYSTIIYYDYYVTEVGGFGDRRSKLIDWEHGQVGGMRMGNTVAFFKTPWCTSGTNAITYGYSAIRFMTLKPVLADIFMSYLTSNSAVRQIELHEGSVYVKNTTYETDYCTPASHTVYPYIDGALGSVSTFNLKRVYLDPTYVILSFGADLAASATVKINFYELSQPTDSTDSTD